MSKLSRGAFMSADSMYLPPSNQQQQQQLIRCFGSFGGLLARQGEERDTGDRRHCESKIARRLSRDQAVLTAALARLII